MMPAIYSPLEVAYNAEFRASTGGDPASCLHQVCKLIIHASVGKMGGTGFFVHPRVIMTAGHCVLAKRKKYYETVEVLPALANNDKPFGKITASVFHVAEKYYKKPDWDLDFGFIILKSSIDIIPMKLSVEQEPVYRASGYRADDSEYEEAECGTQECHMQMVVQQRFAYRMHLSGTLVPGFSGAPLYVEKDDGIYCSGVHSASKPGASVAVRVTSKAVLPEFERLLALYNL